MWYGHLPMLHIWHGYCRGRCNCSCRYHAGVIGIAVVGSVIAGAGVMSFDVVGAGVVAAGVAGTGVSSKLDDGGSIGVGAGVSIFADDLVVLVRVLFL